MTGFVDDVRPYVARAALFLCPMRVGGGTRLKILDALAMGRVLVSTAVGVEGIPMREGEHYLRAETPQEFVEQMTRAAGDPALRDRLGAAGRALVEREYGWAPLGDRLEAAYASAARGTRVAT
ncbi:MAG: glycosyltransferase [Gemmatimonadetes bacterium]|nr:glycosyltransferase [Gemmatimonadota bacterium]